MRILFITQYFSPDIGAGPNRIKFFANMLSKKHEVTVLTAFPHYPQGVLQNEYSHSKKTIFIPGTPNLIRVPIYADYKKNRMRNYLSFFWNVSLQFTKISKSYDICILSIPPYFPIFSLLTLNMCLKRCKKFILDIRDLWPESVEAYTNIPKITLLSLKKITHIFYKYLVDGIITTSYGQEEYLRNIIPNKKIKTIPTGILNSINPHKVQSKIEKLKRKYHINTQDKILLYIGRLGITYNFKPILEALKNTHNVHLFIIGDGVHKHIIDENLKSLKLDKVHLIKSIPLEDLSPYLILSDIGIIPHVRTKIFNQIILAKLFDYVNGRLFIAGEIGDSMKKWLDNIKWPYWNQVNNSKDSWQKFLKNLPAIDKDKLLKYNSPKAYSNNYSKELESFLNDFSH